jgi:predicted  nucleic acid-binding Zn-ribbon protein
LLLQVKDATMKKMKSLEEAKEAVESERDGLKATVASMKRDVDAARQAASSEQKKLDELAHERDILNKLRTQVGEEYMANTVAGSRVLCAVCGR